MGKVVDFVEFKQNVEYKTGSLIGAYFQSVDLKPETGGGNECPRLSTG